MILEDRISRYLTRTKSSSFRPIIVEDLKRSADLHEALLQRKHEVLCRRVSSVRGLFAFLQQVRHTFVPLNGVLVSLQGEMSEIDLNALNLGRDEIAGAGFPVMWVMTRDQMHQVSGCSHLWSCRDLELYDGTTND